jgi:hypothetical protein
MKWPRKDPYTGTRWRRPALRTHPHYVLPVPVLPFHRQRMVTVGTPPGRTGTDHPAHRDTYKYAEIRPAVEHIERGRRDDACPPEYPQTVVAEILRTFSLCAKSDQAPARTKVRSRPRIRTFDPDSEPVDYAHVTDPTLDPFARYQLPIEDPRRAAAALAMFGTHQLAEQVEFLRITHLRHLTGAVVHYTECLTGYRDAIGTMRPHLQTLIDRPTFAVVTACRAAQSQADEWYHDLVAASTEIGFHHAIVAVLALPGETPALPTRDRLPPPVHQTDLGPFILSGMNARVNAAIK